MPIPLVGPAISPTLPYPETLAAHVRGPAQSAQSTARWGRYVVQPGDTLLALAISRGTSVEEIVARNMLGSADSVLRAGRAIALPGGTLAGHTGHASGGQRATGSGSTSSSGSPGDGSHVVRPGQTLSGIAARHGVSTSALAAANGLDGETIRPGQRLTIPQGRALARERTTSARAQAAGTRTVIATVRPGDGLARLAQRYGVSRASILKANNLSPGTMLRAHLHRQDVPTRTQARRLIAAEARRQGVDPTLAVAVAYQESGWSQRAVSHKNAIGVMQCLPSTAGWVSGHVGRDLDLLDTRDNVTCGVALLRSLTRSARDLDEVIGAYYQGLTSVRANGYYADTTRYVANVRAHMERLADS